jgi:transcriptional regulator with XRE-family HTH domain
VFFVGSIETGERIAALRKIKGWSQSELGEKIGLTQASISEIERGTKRGSVESLESIADALDTDIGYLLTGKEPNKDLPKYYMRVGNGLHPVNDEECFETWYRNTKELSVSRET